MKNILMISLCVFVSGCTALDNPFKKKTSEMISFCNVDLTGNIMLKRMTFSLPKIISELKPCQAGKMMHNLTRDHKVFFLDSLSFKNKIYTNNGSMDIRVKGDLNLLGREIEGPKEWLARKKIMWASSLRADYPKHRKIQRVKIVGLDCWRINETHNFQRHDNGIKFPSPPVLLSRGIEYVCWDKNAKKYPPVTISSSMSYTNNKPAFSYSIDQDILMPIFRTIKLRKISNENMLERLEAHKEIIEDDCKFMIENAESYKFQNKYHNINEKGLSRLVVCGYNVSSLRKWWCRETIRDSLGEKSKSQYKYDQDELKENLRSCLD